MEKPSILHLFTSAKNASPFDVNMAFDAGFNKIMPYTSVELSEVVGLTQDAIFSRSPSGVKREGIFIGGRDIDLAMQMLKAAKGAMFAPFACSVLADPSGAFTTAAAMIAKIEALLKLTFGEDLNGKTLSVFGATGPVGGCAAIIAASCGANVQLVAHNSVSKVEAKVQLRPHRMPAGLQQLLPRNLHQLDALFRRRVRQRLHRLHLRNRLRAGYVERVAHRRRRLHRARRGPCRARL